MRSLAHASNARSATCDARRAYRPPRRMRGRRPRGEDGAAGEAAGDGSVVVAKVAAIAAGLWLVGVGVGC